MAGQLSMFHARPENVALTESQVAEIRRRVNRLCEAYASGMLGGTTHESYPDVPEDSRERYLYFTLAPSLNYQRKSESLWRAALATYRDPETRFVYFPENVKLGEDVYKRALVRHGLAVQPEKQTRIWFTLSRTLRRDYEGDPRLVVKEHGSSARQILDALATDKPAWPYLSGPKLSNYWLYMLTCFTDVTLTDREEISVVPDVHVRRATQHLGIVDHVPEADEAADIWYWLLAGTELAPCDVHAPLWRWGRSGFEMAV